MKTSYISSAAHGLAFVLLGVSVAIWFSQDASALAYGLAFAVVVSARACLLLSQRLEGWEQFRLAPQRIQ